MTRTSIGFVLVVVLGIVGVAACGPAPADPAIPQVSIETVAAPPGGDVIEVHRAAPFDALGEAEVTVLRLTPAPSNMSLQHLPPELQVLAREVLAELAAQGTLPPGILPPATSNDAPVLPSFSREPGWLVTDQRPLQDEALRQRLLDLLGHAKGFRAEPSGCFSPSMAISFASPDRAEPVDVVISFGCRQVRGYGFRWPHPAAGLTPETAAALATVHEEVFGAPP